MYPMYPIYPMYPYVPYITLCTLCTVYYPKYLIGIASTGLPKGNMWATKCVTKRP